jgi:hypothetical protein
MMPALCSFDSNMSAFIDLAPEIHRTQALKARLRSKSVGDARRAVPVSPIAVEGHAVSYQAFDMM